jgi:hypothetical protein
LATGSLGPGHWPAYQVRTAPCLLCDGSICVTRVRGAQAGKGCKFMCGGGGARRRTQTSTDTEAMAAGRGGRPSYHHPTAITPRAAASEPLFLAAPGACALRNARAHRSGHKRPSTTPAAGARGRHPSRRAVHDPLPRGWTWPAAPLGAPRKKCGERPRGARGHMSPPKGARACTPAGDRRCVRVRLEPKGQMARWACHGMMAGFVARHGAAEARSGGPRGGGSGPSDGPRQRAGRGK